MKTINYLRKGHDIWLRARTNAFAHKLRYEEMEIQYNVFFVIQTVAVVLPIVCSGVILLNKDNKDLIMSLSLITVISSGIALLISMLLSSFKFQERKMINKSMIANYSLLAQKARRLDYTAMLDEEAKYLIRHLEESFEALKAQGEEPSNKYFIGAKKLLEQMNVQPNFNENDPGDESV
jgi:hypothetical protein